MTDRRPVDQSARERIRRDLDTTFFVEAGAGTGKTTSLVERVVALVCRGTPVSSVAAITFTELAAAELIDRLREGLAKASSDPGAAAVERERAAAALGELDAAAVQTLHGFARRLLAAYPFDAGLPPAFEVLDGASALIEFNERCAAFLDELLGPSGPLPELEFLYALGMRSSSLRDVARALHDNWDRVPADRTAPPAGEFDERAMFDLFDELSRIRQDCLAPDDTLGVALDDCAGRARAAREATSILTRIAFWQEPFAGGRRGQARSWVRPVAEVRAEVADLDLRRRQLLEAHAARCLAVVLDHLGAFVHAYADERRAEGRLHFHDLLVRARDLLRDSPEARATLHRRYPFILIDEFQDTDPLQIEIATLLARPPEVPSTVPWDGASPRPGALFVVGDPKQSIYRFRRADVELYAHARASLGATALPLVQNFRSLPPVLAWVNHVFSRLMSPSPDPARTTHADLASWFPDSGFEGAVHHVGGIVAGASADAARREEATAIAAVVADLCARAPLIRDGDHGRPLRRSDIAVLFRSRDPVPFLEVAFEDAGIPYRVESQVAIYDSQEARDIVAILGALVDPSDEVALVAALRSPAFACSDTELYEFRANGGRWNYLRPSGQPPGPVTGALEWFASQHAGALTRPVNETLSLVLTERRMFETALALRRPRQRWQRYRFLLEQARAFAARPQSDLRRFVDWLLAQKEAGARAVETAAPESDDDAVRFLTVHAAKGLEFPVVILAGLAAGSAGSRLALLFGGSGVEMRVGGEHSVVRTPGYDAALQRDRQLDEYEAVRMLYVAATRARDILVVSLFRSPRQTGGALAALLDVCDPADESVWTAYHSGPPVVERISPVQPAMPLTMADFEAWRDHRSAALQRSANGNAIAATAIAAMAASNDAAESLAVEDDARPWRRGRAGTSIGRAVHAVLQVADLATGDGIEAAAHVQAVAEGVPARETEIVRLARAALQSESVREALAARRHWREVFVGAAVEDSLLEGFIDLAFERDEGFVIVDYKTDLLRGDADVDAAVDRYRLQVAAYALALEATAGRPVVECRLLFLSPRGAIERTVTDLDQARDQARQLLRRSLTGSAG